MQLLLTSFHHVPRGVKADLSERRIEDSFSVVEAGGLWELRLRS